MWIVWWIGVGLVLAVGQEEALMDDGGPWGRPERGVFTDRTRADIERLIETGDTFYWMITLPGVAFVALLTLGAPAPLCVVYWALWVVRVLIEGRRVWLER